MVFAALLVLNPVLTYVLWAVDTTSDPTSLLALLGPFAAAAAALGYGWRDAAKQRDRAQNMCESLASAQTPILAEIRDVLRTVTGTNVAATKAMEAMSEALRRIPTEAEIVRLRDALQQADRQPPSSWRT